MDVDAEVDVDIDRYLGCFWFGMPLKGLGVDLRQA